VIRASDKRNVVRGREFGAIKTTNRPRAEDNDFHNRRNRNMRHPKLRR